MTATVDILAGLRLRLDDANGTRWSNAELTAYIQDGARDYSKYFPRKREMEFQADGETRFFDVPDDLIDDNILKIILIDNIKVVEEIIPHKQLKRRGSDRWYEVVSDKISFGFIPNSDTTIRVRYNAIHEVDTNISVPFEDEDLIYAYAMAAAWQRIGGNDAGLSRWTEGQKRDDSPLIPHYVRLWDRYRRLIEQKQQTPRFYQRVRTTGTWRR